MKSIYNVKTNMNDLTRVLQYENKNVLFRFLNLYNVSIEDARELFEETKKWLYAVAVNRELYKKGEIDFIIGVNDDLLILDEMWHNFILFTKDYNDFCNKYFGFFINHQPMTENETARENIDYEGIQKERKVFFKKQYSFIYDLLGEKTLIKWHKEWPVRYSVENIKKLRK